MESRKERGPHRHCVEFSRCCLASDRSAALGRSGAVAGLLRHDRSYGRRKAEEGNPRPRHAGRRHGLLSTAAGLKARRPNLAFVSSGFSNRLRRTITMQKERSFTEITWKRVPSGQGGSSPFHSVRSAVRKQRPFPEALANGANRAPCCRYSSARYGRVCADSGISSVKIPFEAAK
jgi:hypothetical protein